MQKRRVPTTLGRFSDAVSQEGKAARTRAKLLDAAVRVVSRRGARAASVNEIAAEAGVVNGTVYHHFADKAAILNEIVTAVPRALAHLRDTIPSGEEDAARRVAAITHEAIELAVRDTDWGHTLVELLEQAPSLWENAVQFIQSDVKRGVRQKRFRIEPTPFLFEALIAIVRAAVRARLEGRGGTEVNRQVIMYLLQILGVAGTEAEHIASLASRTARR